jgi:hypothetical protein
LLIISPPLLLPFGFWKETALAFGEEYLCSAVKTLFSVYNLPTATVPLFYRVFSRAVLAPLPKKQSRGEMYFSCLHSISQCSLTLRAKIIKNQLLSAKNSGQTH